MKFDRVIKNGIIVDGTLQSRYRADIAIKDGVVAAIGRFQERDAAEVIDASGMIVAPGFIDLHTHYDAQIYWDPYCSTSSWHGVTSVGIGNCGIGFAPVRPADRDDAMHAISRVEAIPYKSIKKALPWDWTTFPEFLDSLDRLPKAVNVAAYVPLVPLMVWAMGREATKSGRLPTPEEFAEMRRMLKEAVEAGALGWSAQHQPPEGNMNLQRDHDGTPMATDITPPETFYELAAALSELNDGLIQFLTLSEDCEAMFKISEKIAEISGRPVLWNTVAALDSTPEQHRQQLAWLTRCRERGLRVTGQAFVTKFGYTFSMDDWNLFDDSPAWMDATVGTRDERKAKMADPARRSALKANLPCAAMYFDKIVVQRCKLQKNKFMEGQNLRSLSKNTGRHLADIFLDLVVEEDLETVFYVPQPVNNRNDWLCEVVKDPLLVLLDSDGGAHTRFITTGSISTEVITTFVREYGWLTLEEAHWRLSTLPAMVGGFRNRGTLTLGAAADIIVYDYENLRIGEVDVAYDFPESEWRRISRASGYRYVFVNGEVTLREGEQTGTHSGVLLRKGLAASAARM
jgi:N-acyl-D-amino-acid deacylase